MSKHITLCGSMIFQEKMEEIAKHLEQEGFSVTFPKFTEEEVKTGAATFTEYVSSLGGIALVSPDDTIWKIKEEAIREYKEVIDRTDALLVCNFDKAEKKNRIGANVFLEMGYAFFVNKPIFVLQSPPYDDEKIEEILGMRPTFLHGEVMKMVACL